MLRTAFRCAAVAAGHTVLTDDHARQMLSLAKRNLANISSHFGLSDTVKAQVSRGHRMVLARQEKKETMTLSRMRER